MDACRPAVEPDDAAVRRGTAACGARRHTAKKEDRMMRILCLRCLRLWPSERVADRASCPHCGGALDETPR
jgi:Zn finger protein HypA/HybF involved in hydrogenase expression